MTLPYIPGTVTYGRKVSHAYGTDDPAIIMADFGTDSLYILCSKRLAVDVYANNPDYDTALLKQGLKDGWLILVINPTLYESLSNPLTAIRAIKSDAVIDDGWYKLIVIPEWGKRR